MSISKKRVIEAARRASPYKSARVRILEEASASAQNAVSGKHFDVFLCHSYIDAEIVLGIKQIIEERYSFTVFVDWVESPSSRNKINSDNASWLKSVMDNCDNLVYVHTPNSSISKWCPWELGYFDHKNKENVWIALVSNVDTSDTGQEYLNLYKQVDL